MLKLDEKTYSAIFEILRKLENEPLPYKECHVKKIGGTKNAYRIRKGKIRILYTIEKDIELIFIVKIERRSETTYN